MKIATPLLSIVIPTLDRSEEFPSAIISAINSDEDAKIIVSQNESDKATKDACSIIKNQRIDIKYWEKRLVIGDHWSNAVRKIVKTKYFTVIPDDDRINANDYYKLMIKVLDSNDKLVAGFADKRLLKILQHIPHQKISGLIIIVSGEDFLKIIRSDIDGVLDICPTHFTTIFRTNVAKEVGLYPNCHSPDLMLFVNICKMGDIVICLDDPGDYKWNQDGLSKKPNIRMLVSEVMEINKLNLSSTSNVDAEVKARLLIRTQRAIFIAFLRSIRLKLHTESFYALSNIGRRAFLRITMDFTLRLITGRWPKLKPISLR